MSYLKFQIILLCESIIINYNNPSGLGFYNNYNIINIYDRKTRTSLLSRGGSVLIAVRNNFFSKLILIENISIELLFVLLNIYNLFITIGSVFIPHKSNEYVYNVCNSYFDYVESLYKKYHHAIFLMFKLCHKAWIYYNIPSDWFFY